MCASSWDHHHRRLLCERREVSADRSGPTEEARMSWLNTFLKRESPLAEPSTQPQNVEPEGTVELRQGTAEFDEFIARAELDKGENLAHGAHHLAKLLHFDPGNREWMTLFDQYFDKTNGELETLIPRGDELYAQTEAMRALIWQRKGRRADAVALMAQVTPVTHPNYLHEWVLAWVEPDGAIESLPQDIAQHLLLLALTNMPEMREATVAEVRKAQRWAAVTERVLQRAAADGVTVMLRGGILRKAGRFDDALAIVKPAFDAEPDWKK